MDRRGQREAEYTFSLVVQWLRFLSFPGQEARFNHWSGTKIQDAAWCRQSKTIWGEEQVQRP